MSEHRNQNKSILKSLYYRERGLRYCHYTLLNIHVKISGLLRKTRDILCEISKHIREKMGKRERVTKKERKKSIQIKTRRTQLMKKEIKITQ